MSAAFDPWAVLARMRENAPGAPVSANDVAPASASELMASPWPDGVDWHLTKQATELAALIAQGATWRMQPDGSLDLWRAGSGRNFGIGAWRIAQLRAVRLLPEGL